MAVCTHAHTRLPRRVNTPDEFIRYIHEAVEEKEVFIGLDPAVCTLGLFVLCDDVYYCSTQRVVRKNEPVTKLQHSAVECGRMIGQAFVADTDIEYIAGWVALCAWVVRVQVAIEDTTRVALHGVGGAASYVPSTSYWAAALASQCASRSFEVHSANICTVKANFGLTKSGSHSQNKREALSLVKDRLGLAVQTDHEADAFLALATCFFPRLPSRTSSSSSSSSRPSRDPVVVRQQIDRYIQTFWDSFALPATPCLATAISTLASLGTLATVEQDDIHACYDVQPPHKSRPRGRPRSIKDPKPATD